MDTYNTLLWVEENQDSLNFKSLSSMPGLSQHIIRLNMDKDWDWLKLSTNRKLDLDVIQLAYERGYNLNWSVITENYIYEKNFEHILSINRNLPWDTKLF